MFSAIVWKEIRDQFLNVRFHVSLILTFILLVPGTAVLISEYGRQARDMNPYISEGFYTWGFSWYWLNRHIPALQALSTGLGSNIAFQSSNTFYQGPNFDSNSFINNPLQLLFSDLDFVFVIALVGSLLAIVFTYDAISGEREARTLRLILANPAPRALILAGKYVGCFLSFILSLLPGLTGLAFILLIHPDANLIGTHWLSVLYILLISFLYLAVFFMLGIFVSTVTRHPRTSLAALLVAWVMLVLIIPNFSPWLAARLSPVRSIYEVEEEIRVASDRSLEHANRAIGEYTRQLPADRDKWTGEQERKYQELHLQLRKEYILGRVDIVLRSRQAFMNELQRQAEVSRWLSLLSPSASFVLMVSDITNTGMESERNFRRSVFSYKRTYARFVVEELAKGNYNVISRIDKTKIPSFVYRELSLEQAFVKHLSSFLALLVCTALFMIIPQIAFNRMQI